MLLIYEHCKILAIQENKRLSASLGRGKRKLEESEPSKKEATPSKKSKSATGMKSHDEKNDTEETGKEGSEMETDESKGEESWKDEDVGAEEEEGENESDNDSPILSASLGNNNSQPMSDKDDKDNEEKDMISKREKKKEPEKEMSKDSLSEDKESVGEGSKRLRWALLALKGLKKMGPWSARRPGACARPVAAQGRCRWFQRRAGGARAARGQRELWVSPTAQRWLPGRGRWEPPVAMAGQCPPGGAPAVCASKWLRPF
ncbi:uncharacterized protein LOC131873953 [Cryptomeria japonica]|uniref:uncharacterized protein LOC131873953 n=1 Tax=Cryptomeria japonica TaxID=3369 RepID=UPI0027D9DDD6|nr:uncharacterized protein LOC131873953 [Cryptomeria japonica]